MGGDRPTIGVSGPDEGGAVAWSMTAMAVLRAGGRPLRITPSDPETSRPLHGLILGGGADVDPTLYGGSPRTPRHQPQPDEVPEPAGLGVGLIVQGLRRLLSAPLTRTGDVERDELETALLEHAEAKDLPVLGICRGAQLMNVSRSGSLHQDLAEFYLESPQLWTTMPRKTVCLSDGSRLKTMIGRDETLVNSLHRQAVATLGEGLCAVAHEPNGVVQAIEDPAHPFFVGVQWHPEYLPQRSEQQRLFRCLIDEAQRARDRLPRRDEAKQSA